MELQIKINVDDIESAVNFARVTAKSRGVQLVSVYGENSLLFLPVDVDSTGSTSPVPRFPKPLFNRHTDAVVENLFILYKNQRHSLIESWWEDEQKTRALREILRSEG